jgi:hypothetical protein
VRKVTAGKPSLGYCPPMRTLLVLLSLQACTLSTEAPTPPPLEPIDVYLFGEWRETAEGLEALDGQNLGWIEPAPCAVRVDVLSMEARPENDRWTVTVFRGPGRVAYSDDGGAVGPVSILVDGGHGHDCVVAIAAPALPTGDVLVGAYEP